LARASQPDTVAVDEVIAALTGAAGAPDRPDFRSEVERARGYEPERADLCFQALIEHLTDAPDDHRALEALLALGLGFPALLQKHRISMPQEGRRLAILLEKQGEAERAQYVLEVLSSKHPGNRALDHELAGVMRRNGNLARLVERHLARAEQAMREGKREEAIRWLREVLTLDSTRRDVARMIRDLRFEQAQRSQAWRKRARAVAIATVAVVAVAGVVVREARLDAEYATVPEAPGGDLAALQVRMNSIDEMIESNPLWLGMFQAGRERSRLRTEITRIQMARAEKEREAAAERARIETLAEAERSQGRLLAEQSQFDQALEHFQLALRHAPPDWKHRAEVQRDVDAILEWQLRERAPQGGSR
jgi:Flp pilus assembly protein TadD